MRERIRSPVCKSEKAHEHSRHGHAGCIRRSARNGWNGLLREAPPVAGAEYTTVVWTDGLVHRPLYEERRRRPAPWREADAPG